MPVIGAVVEAYIDTDDLNPIIMNLTDDASGADLVANDGIYSRYKIYCFIKISA